MIQLKYKYECRLFLSRLSFVLFFHVMFHV